jgi:hypothetical protein
MTKQEYADYEARVAHYLDGLEFVSTGACSQCKDCGERLCETCEGEDCPNCDGSGYRDFTDAERDCADEPHFSWSSCEVCGSHLGGDRHPWHARAKDGKLVHGTCCSDCLYYLNYGMLDDATMLDMEESTV